MAQTWLAYLWKADSLAWAVAYERDIQQCQQRSRLPSQSSPGIQSLSPKIGFSYQAFAGLLPCDLRMPESRGVGCPDLVRNAGQRKIRNTHVIALTSSNATLPVSYCRKQPGNSDSLLLSLARGDLLRPVDNYQNQSEATPFFLTRSHLPRKNFEHENTQD